MTPMISPPKRRRKRTEAVGPGLRGAINVAFFTILVMLLIFGIALSFPTIRASINIDGMLGRLPPTPATLTTGIRISEVMTSNKRTLPDETGAFYDWIELTNIGSETESLKGFSLSDKIDNPKFTFGDIAIEPGEYLIVFASGNKVGANDLALHAPMKLSSSGETLYLYDNNGVCIESVDLPALPADVSYAKSGSRWNRSESPTPGFENTIKGREAFISSIMITDSHLQLNEIMASNGVTILDQDGDASDWIELFNASAIPIDLSRFALSDDRTNPVKWRFPNGAVIQPYSAYLIFASGKSRTYLPNPHASFKLRADHGVVILSDLMGNVIDSTEYDNLQKDMVWARRRNVSPWEKTTSPSPGMINP